MRTQLLVLSLVLTTTACDDAASPAPGKAPAELVPARDVGKSHTLAAMQALAPAGTSPAELARTLQPRPTRARFLRFTTSAIHHPEVAPVFIERLRDGRESAEVRAALVDALPRTGGNFADELVALFGDERDASVRVAMIGALRRAPQAPAESGLVAGLQDRDPKVRAEAARVAGARPELAGVQTALAAGVRDTDAEVRAATIRSLGLRGADIEAVTVGLRDDEAMVRLEALRAVRRIDPAGAGRRVSGLLDDDYEIVRKAAEQLQK